MIRLNVFLLAVIYSIIVTGNAPAHVVLDYPHGGETFQAGATVTLQWHVALYHGPSDWDLFFSPDGGSSWETIVLDLPETQFTYNWTIPNIATTSGQIKVVQDNATGEDYTAVSSNFTINTATGIIKSENLADEIMLYAAYPNPFNPSTTIRYHLSQKSQVTLKIYNLLGQSVRTLVDEIVSAGSQTLVWDGHDDSGRQLGTGIYLYRLVAGKETRMRKVTLIK